jgi:hypothetical protein
VDGIVENEPVGSAIGTPGVNEKKSTADWSAAPWSRRNSDGRSAVGGTWASSRAISASV